ncbi:hypothetical protein LTR37_003503 [Vermiconidia calcicola]|uniref:Uncharacterized protein n=1 Tax=Vermiconidia calcicola TaxID=1690605 RepID=A0ACC3NQ92_9PEZI|nr:hypothetical protein LTR37_003503 [Vermiconidia calcicola]
MYVDSVPATGFVERSSGWKMPSPHPKDALKLKRPPMVKTGSTSSSLAGMEQAVPSFKNFIKRTPPLDHLKPLPPTPLIPRRASSSSPPRSRTPSSYASRRSSSVYSRTVSQWDLDDISWRSADFADEPLPPIPPLHALAYSASTPQLVEEPSSPDLLEPRMYSPLIISPSPTASHATTPALSPNYTLSVLLPTPPVSLQVPKKQPRTVSLEKAKAAANAPGAVHLLPEEMRAQTLSKSRSHEPLRKASSAMFAMNNAPDIPEPPTLLDIQGRHRSILSTTERPTNATGYPFPIISGGSKYADGYFKVGTGPERTMVSLVSQQRPASRTKALQSLDIDDADEPRGRTRQRGPRALTSPHRIIDVSGRSSSASSREEDASQNIAKQYHSLLTEPHRKDSASSRNHATDSDDSIGKHMKMVPQPLFQNKPPAKLPGSVIPRDNLASVSPYYLRKNSSASNYSRERSSGSSRGSFPLRLSLTPESRHRRTSTSGMIPISPPTATGSPLPTYRSPKSQEKRKKAPRSRGDGNGDKRVSAFYQFVAPRKSTRSKSSSSAKSEPQIPPMPLLSSDIIAQRLKTPSGPPASSPLGNARTTSIDRRKTVRSVSKSNSSRAQRPLFQQIAKGAAKYADLLTKPADLPQQRNYQPITAATVAPGSPHLLPSPVTSQWRASKEVHLGWTDGAKQPFDQSRSPVQASRPSFGQLDALRKPQFTHCAAPARPLDETTVGLTEADNTLRKASIFSRVVDGWKESKAEKRREELKKNIKIVTQDLENLPGPRRASSYWIPEDASMSTFSITNASSEEALADIVLLFEAYATSLGIDLTFQDFAAEIANVPGQYGGPNGALLLARNTAGVAIGCVGIRPLDAEGRCEMKRLYVDRKGRGLGIGKALAEAAIQEAKRLGYGTMRLDTLPTMASARSLYGDLGFVQITPYYKTPIEGTLFMERALTPSR